MLYEYALISVLIACGYWGWFFLRRRPGGTPTFGLMQLAAAGFSGLGLLGRKYDDAPLLGLLGAVGVGAGACLLVVGPVVRGLARRFAAAERLGIATRLLDIAELLAPGSGVGEEKALLGAMREIREGRVEQAVDALTAAKDQAPAEARVAIDERIAMLYLAAYRWDEAIRHVEANLWRAAPPLDEVPAGERPASLREALGVAPPVWVEMIGAYGRTGDLDRAARMLVRLEEVCDNRDEAGLWIHRARLMFLALAGRPAAVQALLSSRNGRHMSPAARSYWQAVALEHQGDRAGATAAYAKAQKRSRGRPRELIDQALERLASSTFGGPVALTPDTQATVARIEAAPLPKQVVVKRPRGPWATVGLSLAIIGVAATIAIALGPSSDPGVLVRSGAMVRSRIQVGEWWRLVSCVFVHVGVLHLVVNGVGLYILGRVAEELYEGAHVVAIFFISGIAGSTASYLASPVGVSAGASGAIFGLLGALFVELTWHRARYRAAWKRGLWGGLVVVTIGQAGVGFLYPVIDQWAHGAGLLGGALAGALLSPNARWAKAGRWLGRGLAVAFAGVAVLATVLVARTSIADSYTREEAQVVHRVGDIAVTAPASWVVAGELSEPDHLIIVSLAKAGGPVDLAAFSTKLAKDHGFEQVNPASDKLLAMPTGWDGREFDAIVEDAMDFRQKWRVIGAARNFGGATVIAVIYLPETIAREIPGLLEQLIASVGPI